MHFSLLLYQTADQFAARSDAERRQAFTAAFMHYADALREAGVLVTTLGLQPPHSATTLRQHDGRTLVQDGPYADTKEQLGGFYVIDVPDLDAALAWAERAPLSHSRVVEVRPNIPVGR